MKPFRIEARSDGLTVFLLGSTMAIFLGLGVYQWAKHSEIYQVLLIISAVLAMPLVGALSVRFTADDTDIIYRSFFTDLRVRTHDVTGIAIVAERESKAPQGVPRFYLVMRDGQRKRLNIKTLPLSQVRQFCSALREGGVSISVQDAFVARRMASQILGSEIKKRLRTGGASSD